MRVEPAVKRAVAFVDGQNLFHAAREAFGYTYPSYDVLELALTLTAARGWSLREVRFYTGIPEPADNRFWHAFWAAKLLAMSRSGVKVFSLSLRYRNKVVDVPGFGQHSFLAGDEKGVDVRIALDVIRMTHRQELDIALLFSQDQDFSELALEVRQISIEQDRWIKIASAFPSSPTSRNLRGMTGTDWIRIERTTYDACIDRRDYRADPSQPAGS